VGGFWLGLAGAVADTADELAKKGRAEQGTAGEQTTQGPARERPVQGPAAGEPAPRQDAQPGQPRGEPEWVNPDEKSWVSGDVEVTVGSPSVGPVLLKRLGEERVSENKLFQVYVSLKNRSENRKIDYESWGDANRLINEHAPRLADNFGNFYKRVHFGLGTTIFQQIKSASIRPGESVADLLVFEEPLNNVEYLRLELPESAFGGTGTMRFQIPRGMIKWK
jgi:hypothetical protein